MQVNSEHLCVSPRCLERLGLDPYQVVVLTASSSLSSSRTPPLPLRCVGRVLPHSNTNNDNNNNNNNIITIHPTLFDFFDAASKSDVVSSSPKVDDDDEPLLLRLAPWSSRIRLDDEVSLLTPHDTAWKLENVSDVYCVDDNTKVQIRLKCIYTEQEQNDDDHRLLLAQHLADQLADRCVQQSTLALVECHGGKCTLVIVESITIVNENQDISEVVRLPFDAAQIAVQVSFAHVGDTTTPVATAAAAPDEPTTKTTTHNNCPGYTSLQTEIAHLLSLGATSRPTGLLLTGSPGVGKTHLVRTLPQAQQHWIRLSDVLWQAMGKTVDELVAVMLPPSSPGRLYGRRQEEEKLLDSSSSSPSPVPNNNNNNKTLVVVDDIQVLVGIDDNPNDTEKRVLLAALLQVMEQCVQSDTPLLAISNTTTTDALPADLIKAGRLEKEISMEAPTSWQRQEILQVLLQSMGCTIPEWAAALASTTAGCVAGDLRQICLTARTRALARAQEDATAVVTPGWEDLKYAAMSTVPSQLALLDVVNPSSHNVMDTKDWEAIHYECWTPLSGCDAIKKRIYRTIVLPWRRLYLTTGPPDKALAGAIVPPSGVLFHGPSGVGKTIAAGCLASSLGLPMIRVRASDVLDKWLGGSEAIIRSLFARARSAAPCVLFFDEIDAIATNRSMDSETVDVMSRVLSTLLNEMDGISTDKAAPRILVVACTNRRGALDAALLRPGRLDEHVELTWLDSVAQVEAVLRQYLARASLDDNLDLTNIAQQLVSEREWSGAELEGLCRAAVLKALRRTGLDKKVCITGNDLSNRARA